MFDVEASHPLLSFYDRLEYFKAVRYIVRPWEYFWDIWFICYIFWYVVPRKIWQPCLTAKSRENPSTVLSKSRQVQEQIQNYKQLTLYIMHVGSKLLTALKSTFLRGKRIASAKLFALWY
jgi:hypothetical protein